MVLHTVHGGILERQWEVYWLFGCYLWILKRSVEMGNKTNLPTIADLCNSETLEDVRKEKELLLLLNCHPPSNWIEEHPTAKVPYIPIGKIEFLLTKIFNKWWVEIRDTKLIANSIVVTIRLYYINPTSGKKEWQDGIGAQPLQTDKGAGATDFNAIKSNAVSLAAPSAESYAIKDAAEKLGKIFGKDLTRKHTVEYEKTILKDIANIESRANKVLEE